MTVLYPKREDTLVVDGPAGRIERGEDGGFDLPEAMATLLHSTPHWETAVERERRKALAEVDRKRDPASALDEIAGLRADLAAALTALAKVQTSAPAKPARTSKAATAKDPEPAAGDGTPPAE